MYTNNVLHERIKGQPSNGCKIRWSEKHKLWMRALRRNSEMHESEIKRNYEDKIRRERKRKRKREI